MSGLDIAGLHCGFHRPVLTGVDLKVASGGMTAILGSSGSGKTTLLRLICGFQAPDSGTIAIDGRRVAGPGSSIPPERRRVGYVAQDGALFPHLSVEANILFGLKRADRRSERAAELLRLVGLPQDYAARPPQHLSGGEQQRVALARALAPAPRLVLLDEPFSALDAALRVDTRRAVAAALQAVGATALLVTHDQAEALSMGDEVAVLRDGRLVQVAAPAALYQHPVDAALARFVGEAVLIEGTATGHRVDSPLGALHRTDAGPEGAVTVLIRPEQIRLVATAPEHARAAVESVTFYGHDASVRLALIGAPPLAGLAARVSGHAVPGIGAECGLIVEGPVIAYARGN